MARFERKRGAAGWPGPQTRRIESWANAWSIDVDVHVAQSGTRYLTLAAPDGAEIKVRVADHADAYATADYTVNPAEDHRPVIQQWICEHGERSRRRSVAQLRRIAREINRAGWTTAQPTPRLVQVIRDGFVLASIGLKDYELSRGAPSNLQTLVKRIVELKTKSRRTKQWFRKIASPT